MPKLAMAKTLATFLPKNLSHMHCDSLINQLIIPKRKTSKIYIRKPQQGLYHAAIDKIVEGYNLLPAEVKSLNMGPFKRYMRKNTIKIS